MLQRIFGALLLGVGCNLLAQGCPGIVGHCVLSRFDGLPNKQGSL